MQLCVWTSLKMHCNDLETIYLQSGLAKNGLPFSMQRRMLPPDIEFCSMGFLSLTDLDNLLLTSKALRSMCVRFLRRAQTLYVNSTDAREVMRQFWKVVTAFKIFFDDGTRRVTEEIARWLSTLIELNADTLACLEYAGARLSTAKSLRRWSSVATLVNFVCAVFGPTKTFLHKSTPRPLPRLHTLSLDIRCEEPLHLDIFDHGTNHIHSSTTHLSLKRIHISVSCTFFQKFCFGVRRLHELSHMACDADFSYDTLTLHMLL